MFARYKLIELQQALRRAPAGAVLGPRQVGKTTLAWQVAQPCGLYLDLESPEDRSKLDNAKQYLRSRQNRLMVLDEVQRLPTLFEPLRGLIGQPLLHPQSPDLLPGPEFIAWNQHNVFKTPARV